jgi:SPOR domain
MNSPTLRTIPQVNLEEFEQRLRTAATPQSAQEDPLAELARIVGIDGPPQRPNENVVSLAPRSAQIADLGLPSREPLIRVSFAESQPAVIDPPVLRPAFEDHASAETSHEATEGPDLFEDHHFEPDASQPESVALPPTARASRGGRYATVALLSILGVAGLGAAVAVKYGAVPGLHKAPPVIMASEAPTKVAPPSSDTVAPPNDTASVLFKDQPAKPAAVKMVSTEEQPVDLHTQGIDPAAPVAAAPAALPAPTTAATGSPIAANPDAPLVAPVDAAPTVAASVASPLFAVPKRVKTVSVRPDGTLIAAAEPVDSAPATRAIPVIPAPTADANADAGLPQPATPKLDLPLKPRAKSTARVQVGKTDTTGVAADAALQLGPPTKLERAAKVARAKPAAPLVAGAVDAPIVTAAVDPTTTQTAAPAASTPAPAVSSAGNFSVQLAAPTSNTEAQSAANRLKAKYASELNGMEPTIHKADLAQGTVYRVRVGDLSRADAVALCEKLKASGGACFVARN